MKLRAALLLVSMLVAGKSYASPMFVVPSQDPFINNSYAFGELFTVGPSDLLVTSVGAYDAFGEGFFTNGGIPVGIFRESDGELLASELVLSEDPLVDVFRYHTMEDPLVLQSGVAYRVVAVNRDDLYNIRPGFITNPLITRTGYEYCRTRFLIACDPDAPEFQSGTDTIWMANFNAEPIGPSPVPEPASIVLMGTGLAAILTRARRAKRR